MKISKLVLAALASALMAGTAMAETSVKIGVLNDRSGIYADLAGEGSVIAAQMAVEDFKAAEKGITVEIISADHQNKPDVASTIARQWYDQEGVDVILDGDLPPGARPDLSVDGTVLLERLVNVIYVGRPAFGQENSTVGLFKLAPDGSEATRVNVRLGRTSVNTVEVLGGLQPGEKVIISDMSRWDGVDRVRVE